MATFDLGRVTPLYKGDYSASASYELNDVVLHNGNLYWHIQATATVGILPTDTTVWKLAFADEGVRAEIRGYADDAQASADSALASKSAAATSASNASASASQAASSAQAASTKASEASTSAQTASSKASEATVSAQSAASSAQTATDNATLATNKAQAASESASLATAKANAAATSETNAAASAQTASAKASEAAASAVSAQEYDESAQASAVNAQTAQTAAETAQTGAETAQGLAEDARDLAQQYAESINPENIYSAYPTDTASGAVASFADGADDIPLKSLVVDINPVQDLHGQDAPYPAGGGKNLWNGTLINGDVDIDVKVGVTYTVSAIASSNAFLYLRRKPVGTSDYTRVDYVVSNATSGSATFVPEEGYIYSLWSNQSYSSIEHVQIEVGSTATAYAPYENICPISGWTGANVARTGVNVWDEEWELGTIRQSDGLFAPDDTRIRSKNFNPCVPETTYYVKDLTNGYNISLRWYDANEGFISSSSWIGNTTITSPANAYYFTFVMASAYGTTYNHDISINYPSTDTSYHEGHAQTIPISWQTEAGTVYGGHLDVLTGVLTVDRVMVTLSELSCVKSASTHETFRANLPKAMATGTNIALVQCSTWKGLSQEQISPHTDNYVWGSTTNGTIRIKSTAHENMTVDEFKAAFADTQFVYKLATPITIQLTPHEVKSLLGANNIFADTGDSSVEYRADTKMYIERLTEPDADMIADSNIVSGQYFMVGNSLYLATSNIASGGQVIVGTNATRKSLAQALNEINQ